MKRLQLLLLVVAMAMLANIQAYGAKSYASLGAHNIATNGCLSCHAPHNGSVATGGTSQTTGTILLWDRAFTTQTFGTYSSPTMGNAATEVGTTTPTATEARLYSFLCLSCHDGVTSVALIAATSTKAVGNPTNSFGLQNDHPVNMSQNPTNDAGLAATTAVIAAGLKLYGTANTVQCASCHDAHDNTNTKFLRIANTNSAVCTTCHI